MRYLFFLIPLSLIWLACTPAPAPLVVVATPAALDNSFQTYTHPSGVFSLRVPPDWIPDELPDENGLRLQFTAIENNARVVRLSLTVVNTGAAMTAENFIQAVNAYQPPAEESLLPWTALGPSAAMSDGSVRLLGIRDYPALGPRALNIFLQGNGAYFSALEADVTAISPEQLETLLAVVNTYQVRPEVPLNVGQVVEVGALASGGVLQFQNYAHWEDENGGLNITGQVVNTGETPLEAVRLTAYLFDSGGGVLAEEADILVYEILAPGETAPFRLRFDTGRPSTVVRYELQAAARAANVSNPPYTTYLGEDQFVIGQDSAGYTLDGDLVLRGLVQNNSGGLAGNIKLVATVFDEQGRVIGSETSFLPQDSLIPSEAVAFELTLFDLGGSAARYTLVAQGQRQ